MPEPERRTLDTERILLHLYPKGTVVPAPPATGFRGTVQAVKEWLRHAKHWQLLTAGLVVTLWLGAHAYYYNRLVDLEYNVDETWSEVGALQQRRAHIQINLGRLMAEHSRFERELLSQLTQLRTGIVPAVPPPAATPPAPAAAAVAPGQPGGPQLPTPEQIRETLAKGEPRRVTELLRQIQIVAEQYPHIGLTEIVKQVNQAVIDSETRIADGIARHNRAVNIYTTYRSQFPTICFAWILGFKDRKFFAPESSTQVFRPYQT